MRLRLFAVFGAAMSISGCTCVIDPEGVEPPVVCVADCTGKACGVVECGTTCAPGSGCVVTHSIQGGGVTLGGGRAASSAHQAQGALVPAAGKTDSPNHTISGGTLK